MLIFLNWYRVCVSAKGCMNSAAYIFGMSTTAAYEQHVLDFLSFEDPCHIGCDYVSLD